MKKVYNNAMFSTPSPIKEAQKDMIERRKTDRKEECDLIDLICPPDKDIYTSSFVSKALAFNVKRQIESLNSATNLVISSTKDSVELIDALKNLVSLVNEDPRLGNHLDSQVLPHLVQFLKHNDQDVYEDDITKEGPEDNKSFKLQYYSAVILKKIVSSNKGIKFKDEAIPLLLNLIPSPARSVQIQTLHTLTNIADAFPDSSETMIENGALELLESVLSDKWNHYLVLKGGAQLLTAFCRMKPLLISDKIEIVIRTIRTAIEYDYPSVLTQLCLALSILCNGGFVAVGTEVERLIDLICYRESQIVISALQIIGTYVRWGDEELIQFMIEQGLLLRLGKLLYHEHTIIRKETCWIISNITAVANHSQIQRLINMNIIEILMSLVRKDELEVKEYAACAISNAVSGSDKKQFEFLEDICFLDLEFIRLYCHDDRVFTLCSQVLDKILYRTNNLETNIYSIILKSAFLPKTVERSSKYKKIPRKKLIKGKKLFDTPSPPDFAFDVIEDLDSKDFSGDISTVTSLTGDSTNSSGDMDSEEIAARKKHSSFVSSEDSGSKEFTRGKKFNKDKEDSPSGFKKFTRGKKYKRGKEASPEDSGSKMFNRKKRFKKGKVASPEDSGSKMFNRKKRFKKGKVASPDFSKRLHRRFG